MKQTTLLQISKLGHPILRKKTKSVKDVSNHEVQQLIENMIVTCKDVDGVGIAAPQVYQSLKLFIVASRKNPRYPKAPNMKPLAVINPKIISHSDKQTKDWEGCLSIPGIRAIVPRFAEVTFTYQTLEQETVTKTYDGFLARIFQHEYDHLNGKVFLDSIDSSIDLYSEKEFLKQTKRNQR